MALLLVMGVNHTHADPIKDARGCYKRGDIVEVLEDSKHDGDLVRNPIAPPWFLVRITGVTKDQVEKYLEPEMDTVDLARRVRRRRFRLDADTIPLAIRTQLVANRYVEVTPAQIRDYLLNKQTGLPE